MRLQVFIPPAGLDLHRLPHNVFCLVFILRVAEMTHCACNAITDQSVIILFIDRLIGGKMFVEIVSVRNKVLRFRTWWSDIIFLCFRICLVPLMTCPPVPKQQWVPGRRARAALRATRGPQPAPPSPPMSHLDSPHQLAPDPLPQHHHPLLGPAANHDLGLCLLPPVDQVKWWCNFLS